VNNPAYHSQTAIERKPTGLKISKNSIWVGGKARLFTAKIALFCEKIAIAAKIILLPSKYFSRAGAISGVRFAARERKY
jgi:hypothetical protein